MASRTEGIALLSVYNDEEEEEDEDEEGEKVEEKEEEGEGEGEGEGEEEAGIGGEEKAGYGGEGDLKVPEDGAALGPDSGSEKTPPVPQSGTPSLQEEDSERKTLASPGLPTPTRTPPWKLQAPPPTVASQNPAPQGSISDAVAVRRSSKRSLTIVDYAHDETAMSPDNEVIALLVCHGAHSSFCVVP